MVLREVENAPETKQRDISAMDNFVVFASCGCGKKVNEDKEIRFSTYVLILQNDETNLGGFGWVGAKDCRERQSARRLVT